MAWKQLEWDVTFVSLGLVTYMLYHYWLCRLVKKRPQRTNIGVNNSGQSLWIAAMMMDNDKKNILAVQTLRNNLMASSLVATASLLFCCGLMTFTATISDKQDLVMSSLNQFEVSHKSTVLLLFFLSVFFCHILSVTFLNHVCMLVNTLILQDGKLTVKQASMMLDMGILLSTIGNRLLFVAMPLSLWIYSPVLVFASSAAVVAVLYSIDIVHGGPGRGSACGWLTLADHRNTKSRDGIVT